MYGGVLIIMSYQSVFKRYELKYLITKEQKNILVNSISPYMALDKYGRTTIRNIYFDTDNFLLIRRSIEKPDYKEKLRIRSYHRASSDSQVFVELKKKYNSIVYKRRISLSESDATEWICNRKTCITPTQISKEVDYFMEYYSPLHPKVFLSYEREAYYSTDRSDFRVTFDENILFREEDLSLKSDIWGTKLLDDNVCLMELKCSGGIPLWMTSLLSREHIYKTSFSKYGNAYQNYIYHKLKETNNYV